MSGALPESFVALEPFASFALPTERARHAAIQAAALAAVQAFYDAMLPALPAALDHLNGFPLSDMPMPQRRLLDLCLAMAEAAMAIENYGALNPPYLMPVDRFEPMHDTWEAAP
jgi:hypothetical protein